MQSTTPYFSMLIDGKVAHGRARILNRFGAAIENDMDKLFRIDIRLVAGGRGQTVIGSAPPPRWTNELIHGLGVCAVDGLGVLDVAGVS